MLRNEIRRRVFLVRFGAIALAIGLPFLAWYFVENVMGFGRINAMLAVSVALFFHH